MNGQNAAYRPTWGTLILGEMVEQELGSDFDIRAFHQAILGPGALPLSVLEEQIRVFIQKSIQYLKLSCQRFIGTDAR